MEPTASWCAEAERDFEGFWARLARETLPGRSRSPRCWTNRRRRSSVVRRRRAERLLQLPRPAPRDAAGDKTAIIFEADDGKVTQGHLPRAATQRVCRFANALKARGIKKGDRVVIYMPMSIEGVVAMQACARIGATHSVVFGGFSAKALHERIIDAGAVAVITADEQLRGGKEIAAEGRSSTRRSRMGGCEAIKNVIVYKRTGSNGADGSRRATSGCTTLVDRRRPTPASRNGSTPSIRCSSSTPRARPASPRACSTPPAATCCGRR